MSTKESVTIKVPRVPDYIRKEKKEVKIHMEEAKKLMATPFRKPRHENLVRYLNVAYDDFRKEIWVVRVFHFCRIFSQLSNLGLFRPQIRDYVDGSDLETLMKNPSLSPALRSPEERIKIALGISKVLEKF